MFKVTHAGRLQLIVHKESPPTAANEIKEIAIDEFGGLEFNLKLDSEKYVFAIITTQVTECFSTETPQQLTEWKQLLQEYLGKGKGEYNSGSFDCCRGTRRAHFSKNWPTTLCERISHQKSICAWLH